jgi:hypothetical protein
LGIEIILLLAMAEIALIYNMPTWALKNPKTLKCVVASSIFYEKKMNWAKGRQGKKEALLLYYLE